MKTFNLPLLIVFQALLVIFVNPANAATPIDSLHFVPGRLIVKYAEEVTQPLKTGQVSGLTTSGITVVDRLHAKYGVTNQRHLVPAANDAPSSSCGLDRVYVLDCPATVNLDSAVAAYAALPEVAWAEKDVMMQLFEAPNDSLFDQQWYLNNTGQEYVGVERRDGYYDDTQVIKVGSADADIDGLEAFLADRVRVSPLIGIVDAGIDLDHEDLAGQIWVNPGEDLNGDGVIDSSEIDSIDNDHDGYIDDFYGWDFCGDAEPEVDETVGIIFADDNDPTDTHGHGTHVAGIAAAARGNGIGVSGVAWPARVMALKVFPWALTSVCVQAIVFAADHGCDVINLSWGGAYRSLALQEALDYAVAHGCLPVAAAGNAGHLDNYPSYPAAYANTFTVGATNSLDEVTYFSSYGDYVDVAAPGRDILSLRADSLDPYEYEPAVHIVAERYYLMDGTSMAAPVVTGIAACLRAVAPQLSVDSLRRLIELSAEDIVYPYGGDSLYSPGVDQYSGHGRVNLSRALALVEGHLVDIRQPAPNQPVSGEVAVIGSALFEADEVGRLEYGAGADPDAWTEISVAPSPVYDDTLAVWNTAGLSGRYCLRLSIGQTDRVTVPVLIENSPKVEISSPLQGTAVQGTVEVVGSAVLPNFASYSLDCGAGSAPSSWACIYRSTQMRSDELLGEWPVSFLESGEYALRLTVYPDSGESISMVTTVQVESELRDFWTTPLAYNALSPAVGDVDGDSLNEIVLGLTMGADGAGGGVHIYDLEGHRQAFYGSSVSMDGPPALGNLDDDGIDDIVVTSLREIYVYRSGAPDWSAYARGTSEQRYGMPPLICDIENDGLAELLFLTGDWLYGWDRAGTTLSSSPAITCLGGDLRSPMVIQADLDGDGPREIIAGGNGLFVLNEGLEPIRQSEDSGFRIIPNGMAVGNLDDSPDLELVVIGETGHFEPFTINVLKLDGRQLDNFPIVLEDLAVNLWLARQPAIGDLDGDGLPEIVVSFFTAGEARVYAWHCDGTPLGSIGSDGLLVKGGRPDALARYQRLKEMGMGENLEEINHNVEVLVENKSETLLAALTELDDPDPVFAGGAEVFGSPILADVNGDHLNDIILFGGVYLSTNYCRLFAYDYEGRSIAGFPIVISPTPRLFSVGPSDPSVGDIDRDGFLDILTLSGYPDACMSFWEFSVPFDSADAPWPKYLHDNWNSGVAGFEPDPDEVISEPPLDFRLKHITDSSIIVAWTPKEYNRSTGYRLYRSSDLGVYPIHFDSVSLGPNDSCYEDIRPEPGGYYRYFISNFDYYNRQSELSFPVAGWYLPGESTPVSSPPPDFRLAALEPDAATFKWLPVPNVRSIGYNIYRSSDRNEPGERRNSETIPRVDSVFCDNGFQVGEYYYYYITNVDSTGVESPPSLDIDLWCSPEEGPISNCAPQHFQACNVTDLSVVVCWEPKSAWQSSGYHIYRSEKKDLLGEKIHNFTRPQTDSSYEDRSVKIGRFYYYSIVNLDTLGEVGRPSGQSAASFEPGAQETPGRAPYAFRVSSVTDSGVFLRWQPRPPWKSVGYNIYRSFGPGTAMIRVNDEIIPQEDSVYEDARLMAGLHYFYSICSLDSERVEGSLSNAVECMIGAPADYTLNQNYPNPFNPATTISFMLPQQVQVKLDVYNCLGRHVRQLVDQRLEPGPHSAVWNGNNDAGKPVSSGVYFYRLTAGSAIQTRKMLLLR